MAEGFDLLGQEALAGGRRVPTSDDSARRAWSDGVHGVFWADAVPYSSDAVVVSPQALGSRREKYIQGAIYADGPLPEGGRRNHAGTR